jgi:hypothetical protein
MSSSTEPERRELLGVAVLPADELLRVNAACCKVPLVIFNELLDGVSGNAIFGSSGVEWLIDELDDDNELEDDCIPLVLTARTTPGTGSAFWRFHSRSKLLGLDGASWGFSVVNRRKNASTKELEFWFELAMAL